MVILEWLLLAMAVVFVEIMMVKATFVYENYLDDDNDGYA